MKNIENNDLLKYIEKIYAGTQDGYVLVLLPDNKGVFIDTCIHNISPERIEYYLIEEMKRLMKLQGKELDVGQGLKKDIQKLKKSDTRFKDNQVYNQAIDDVLEAIK